MTTDRIRISGGPWLLTHVQMNTIDPPDELVNAAGEAVREWNGPRPITNQFGAVCTVLDSVPVGWLKTAAGWVFIPGVMTVDEIRAKYKIGGGRRRGEQVKRLDAKIRDLCRKIDAEKVTVTFEFDKASWWQRRRIWPMYKWSVEVAWEDKDEKFRASGYVTGGTLDEALAQAEADVNGTLLRQRAGGDERG